MTTPLRLASINIERSKHIHRAAGFIHTHQPDVVCLQEVLLDDLPLLTRVGGPHLAWAPMTRLPEHNTFPGSPADVLGVALLSRLPLQNISPRYYRGNGEHLPQFQSHGEEGWQENVHAAVLLATIHHAGQRYRLGTTHFTWTAGGLSTPEQLQDAEAMLAGLADEPELILCGDFNAPRGRATFTRLAEAYADNIPDHYTSSIDGTLHRAGPLPLMVDGLFTTPHYRADDVTLHSGVSDHCAITARLSRTDPS